MAERLIGTVKWFNNTKGYGFIAQKKGEDVFVHFSDIQDEKKYKSLNEGDKVEFSLAETDRGFKAVEVVVLR